MKLSGLLHGLTALFLWTSVLDAPLRYGLAALHLDALIYLPKLLLLMAVVVMPLVRPRTSVATLFASIVMAIWLLWGLVNLPSPAQALFGFWVFVPLLYGLWAGALLPLAQWRRLFLVLFCVAAMGVLLNPLVSYPWSGQSVDLLGQSISVSRQWTTFGIDRYAGFARASFDAASQLLIFGIMSVLLLQRRTLKLLVWLVAGAGIALTTSKGPFGAWLLVSLYFLGGAFLRWQRFWRQTWLIVLALIMVLMTVLPLWALASNYDPTIHGRTAQFLFASFGDRMNWMWPDSLKLLVLDGDWHFMVGRGLGGIGTAQMYFEPSRFFAADNLFVYLAVDFGVPLAVGIIGMIWLRTALVARAEPRGPGMILPLMLVLMVYGVVVNEIESGVLAFFLGLLLASNPRSLQMTERNIA
ncbi:MAG: hypothetical protein ACYCY1_15365 [Sulfuriferula sp.]